MSKRLKILLNYGVGPVLLVWLIFSIYHQITQQKNIHEAIGTIFSSANTFQLLEFLCVLLLMFVNWGLEAFKWQQLLKGIQQVSFLKAFKAIFTGQAFAFNTINSVGEYFGRIIFLNEGNRLRAIAVTVVGSMSQFIVTFFMGFCGLIYMQKSITHSVQHIEGINQILFKGFIWISFCIVTILLIIYYSLSSVTAVIEKLPFIAKYAYFIQKVEELHAKQLTIILSISFIRYVVFVGQYLLLLHVFNVNANPWDLSWLIAVKFLVLAVIPTIALAELGLRGEIGVQLLGLVSNNTVGILFCTLGIWLINRVLPALLGGIFILGVRLFKNK